MKAWNLADMATAAAKPDVVVRIAWGIVQVDAEQPCIASIVPIAATDDSPARRILIQSNPVPIQSNFWNHAFFIPASKHFAHFVHKL